MNSVTKIIIYFIVAAVALDVLTHASGFATATNSASNGFNSALKTISGSGA